MAIFRHAQGIFRSSRRRSRRREREGDENVAVKKGNMMALYLTCGIGDRFGQCACMGLSPLPTSIKSSAASCLPSAFFNLSIILSYPD